MFSVNLIVADNVLQTTGMTQEQLDKVVAGIHQAAELWSRYIDGNNAVIDIELGFEDLSGSTLAQAGSSFYRQGNGPLQSEVINELNGQSGVFSQDGTFTVDLPNVLNDRFFYSSSLDFDANPGAPGQIDFLTLAAHELGHVLGFLGLSFEGFVVNNEFVGANAMAANGGNPVPLADGVHTAGGDLLSPSISSNTREPLDPILIAMLKDIGVPIAEATANSDVLYGYNKLDDILDGQNGDDQLFGLTGDDILLGNRGVDTLHGGEGDDKLYGGDDDDILHGHADNDLLRGNNGEDILNGDGGFDKLYGGNGNDKLYGGSGNDSLFGEADNDELRGDDGNDFLSGGVGVDRLYGNANNDRLLGEEGNDILFGGSGNDRLEGGIGQDFIRGGSGNDFVKGGNQGDTIYGDSGVDRLFGEQGRDVLFGGFGNDLLNGGLNGDRLNGDSGRDNLYGGTGNDVFIFKAGNDTDIIRDFENDADKIELQYTLVELQSALTNVQSNDDFVWLDFGNGDILFIQGVVESDITESDFMIV